MDCTGTIVPFARGRSTHPPPYPSFPRKRESSWSSSSASCLPPTANCLLSCSPRQKRPIAHHLPRRPPKIFPRKPTHPPDHRALGVQARTAEGSLPHRNDLPAPERAVPRQPRLQDQRKPQRALQAEP